MFKWNIFKELQHRPLSEPNFRVEIYNGNMLSGLENVAINTRSLTCESIKKIRLSPRLPTWSYSFEFTVEISTKNEFCEPANLIFDSITYLMLFLPFTLVPQIWIERQSKAKNLIQWLWTTPALCLPFPRIYRIYCGAENSAIKLPSWRTICYTKKHNFTIYWSGISIFVTNCR